MTYKELLYSRSMSSNTATKKGHLMILTNARDNVWEKRWLVLKRYGRARGTLVCDS